MSWDKSDHLVKFLVAEQSLQCWKCSSVNTLSPKSYTKCTSYFNLVYKLFQSQYHTPTYKSTTSWLFLFFNNSNWKDQYIQLLVSQLLFYFYYFLHNLFFFLCLSCFPFNSFFHFPLPSLSILLSFFPLKIWSQAFHLHHSTLSQFQEGREKGAMEE